MTGTGLDCGSMSHEECVPCACHRLPRGPWHHRSDLLARMGASPEDREVAEAIAARSPNQWEITDTNPEETP